MAPPPPCCELGSVPEHGFTAHLDDFSETDFNNLAPTAATASAASSSDSQAEPTQDEIETAVYTQPPCIIFQPPLQQMRHNKIYDIVIEWASQQPSGEATKPRSILDLGCGNAELLRRVVRETAEEQGGEDGFPLRRASGIDIQEELVRHPEVAEMLDGLLGNERWNKVLVELMHGSFQELEKVESGMWDVVVSSEVVEHLDPEPLKDFPEIILEHLKPQLAVISTPDRRFNRIFDILEEYMPEDYEKYEKFHWPGIDYELRHDDHRFEWTASEFQDWANKHAKHHEYSVTFTGVGAFGDPIYGATVAGLDYAGIREEFFNRIASENISDAPCTQIAIFTRIDTLAKSNKQSLPEALEARVVYRKEKDAEPFPPSIAQIYEGLELLRFREHLNPEYADAWYANSKPFSGTKRVTDIPAELRGEFPYEEIWAGCHPTVKMMCRENMGVFCEILQNAFDPENPREVGPLQDSFYEVEATYAADGIKLHYWFCMDGMDGYESTASYGSHQSICSQGPDWDYDDEHDVDQNFHDVEDAAEAGAWWSGDEGEGGNAAATVGEIEGGEGWGPEGEGEGKVLEIEE